MKRYFVVGTDTDCGKTYATCQLITYLRKQNKRVKAIKPVASGCHLQNGQWVSEDEIRLKARQEDKVEDIGLWRFKEPIAPHIAAQHENKAITIESLSEFCKNDAYDYLLIEGAGGLMVPLNQQETWLDFLINEQISVIIIVGMRLGCINHALLTSMVLKTSGVDCKGWIANCMDRNMLYLEENKATLIEKMNAPLIGTIPYQGDLSICELYSL